jgi:RsiW-degrading membrane proteinase PrsW (M82 family)
MYSNGEFICISGPDKGKRISFNEHTIKLGRSSSCGLLSDDPELGNDRVALKVVEGKLKFQATENARVFVDGVQTLSGSLPPGKQLRAGRSVWQFEVEPRPWLFFKALVLTVLVYLGFVFAWKQFHNTNLIPGMIMVGASAIPLTVVLFYFEMNAPRNVSLHRVLWMLLVGGIVSLITSLFGFNMFGRSLDWLGASQAGIIEETGKLLALLIIAHKAKYRWTLNGLLFGGAVGAGFAAFESAGYAFRSGLGELTIQTLGLGAAQLDGVFENIWVRGLLTPGGHVAWTALVGAGLWKVRGDQPFNVSMLKDARFLRVFGLAMLLHMIWNSPFGTELPFLGKYLLLAGVAWMAIFGFIQDGLNQIRSEQVRANESSIRHKKAAAR